MHAHFFCSLFPCHKNFVKSRYDSTSASSSNVSFEISLILNSIAARLPLIITSVTGPVILPFLIRKLSFARPEKSPFAEELPPQKPPTRILFSIFSAFQFVFREHSSRMARIVLAVSRSGQGLLCEK